MTLSHPRRAGRSAFTLVELLVVVAIIAVLVSLTAAAVMKFLGEGEVVQNTSEIRQLETAIAAFHRDFNLGKEYFPSRFVLCKSYASYFAGGKIKSQIHADSLAFLQRMFPRLWGNNTTQATVVDWNGTGATTDAEVVLEGDQCLVFFLGGIQDLSGGQGAFACRGFSTSGTNPAANTPNRKGPYYEFPGGRLVVYQPPAPATRTNTYLSCLDVYKKKPFAYFSSYATPNGYNKYFDAKNNPTSDCASLGVWPYAESITASGIRYQYPRKFQIISAGDDQKFGMGTNLTLPTPMPWTPATAQSVPGEGPPAPNPKEPTAGQDDQANFYPNLLGRSE
jgi:prepilin-type N-terminal cleavage/methylation domain-containing protein